MAFPVDAKYISATERELGLLFPEAFMVRMERKNGGNLITEDDEWQLFPFFDQADSKRMSKTCNHITLETKEARSWENFPANAIAIASNGTGDHLILLPSDLNAGKLTEQIFLWHHETGNIEMVAESIDELSRE